MKEEAGKIINFAKENIPVPGCTVSKQIHDEETNIEISVFSLAENTEISAEVYSYHKLWLVYSGEMTYFEMGGKETQLHSGECVCTATGVPVGVRADKDCIYVELGMKKGTPMNKIIKAGEAFKLADLLPYQEGKIVNMDVVREPGLKFALMSFDKGTGLSEHAAPGEALVFALDGEAIIGYEGKDYVIKAGETFKFDIMGKHAITATEQFKMGLLLVWDEEA